MWLQSMLQEGLVNFDSSYRSVSNALMLRIVKVYDKKCKGRLLVRVAAVGALFPHEKGLREAGLGGIREATRFPELGHIIRPWCP